MQSKDHIIIIMKRKKMKNREKRKTKKEESRWSEAKEGQNTESTEECLTKSASELNERPSKAWKARDGIMGTTEGFIVEAK